MPRPSPDYIPPLRYRWLTPLYDPLQRSLFRESAFKRDLVARANIPPASRVLDLGCGTATLTIMIKHAHLDADVVGLDPDPQALAFARAKAARAGTEIAFDLGTAVSLPYPTGSFDRALSSLMLHHLTREQKQQALRDVFRVLRPGGELHFADIGKPHNALMWLLSAVVGRFEDISDNVRGLLPDMARAAGFDPVEETGRYAMLYGTVRSYRARRPEQPRA